MSIVSEYSAIAKGITETPYGGLNFVTCGDPAQLPPPGSKSLFERTLISCYKMTKLNALNKTAQYQLKGIHAWHQVNNVVFLDEVMRQKGDDDLIDLLGRLRTGTCTVKDKEMLDQYVLDNPRCSPETKSLTNIERWVVDRTNAATLITYTNAARDAHNLEMSRAFASLTGQEFRMYHSIDTYGGRRKQKRIRGEAAEVAWQVPCKSAGDMGGKVAYITGMPVYGTQNIATELGISKGSMGTLVKITYTEREGRRYAETATVDFPTFNAKTGDHPNRVVLSTFKEPFSFKLPNSEREYSATRQQLPLIPAFACTSHNSQGRTMDVACVDLASCASIQSAYVMLSRVKSREGLCILRPFNLKKIQNHIAEELRNEMKRTNTLAMQTTERATTNLKWFYDRFPDQKRLLYS